MGADHAGPFRVPDWDGNPDGNDIFSLKICINSGKLFSRMVKTTGVTTRECMDGFEFVHAPAQRALRQADPHH